MSAEVPGRRRRIRRSAEKRVVLAVDVEIIPDDLAGVVNSLNVGFAAGRGGVINGGIDSAAVDESVNAAIGIYVIADNLAGVVDAGGICAVDGQRMVQGAAL